MGVSARALRGAMLSLTALLAGCQTSLERLQVLAEAGGRPLLVLPDARYPLAAIGPGPVVLGERLRVYLEGDGHAWATARQPSLDPSPRRLMVAGLALDDPGANLYLARPCQFVRTEACAPALWTHRRYGAEVVARLDAALDQLKARYGNRQFELVGYSGGATLALLLASRRDDVAQVQTLAGNLSPQQWVQLKGLTPMDGSLEPLDQRERLARVPQRHLVGEADAVVPPVLLQHYRTKLGQGDCLESSTLPGVSHASGWAEAWRAWRDRPLQCQP